MPKLSKVRSVRARAPAATPKPEGPSEFRCARCGKTHLRQYGNFAPTQSPLFRGNGGYTTICYHCLDELYEHYRAVLGSDREACRRMCLKFDLYWHPTLFEMADAANPNTPRFHSYVAKANLKKFFGKTYDDTLDEEGRLSFLQTQQVEVVHRDDDGKKIVSTVEQPVEYTGPSAKDVSFWGEGWPPEKYFSLNGRYAKWTSELQEPPDMLTEARYKQICLLEENINACIMSGKPCESSVNTLNNLIKDIQKSRTDATDEAFDDQPFGVGIRMYENKRPIPKPIEELKDVDGVKKYISVWFVGHLAKMLGLKNSYSRLYEEELAKYRVDRPDLDEEDDEGAFYEIFKDKGSE